MNRILILLLLLSNSVFSQVNLNQGLVAYYPFNGNANDASGNGNNGTPLNGVQLTTDRFGNTNSAYYFDGVDDYISVSNSTSLNPANGISVALYFNPSRNGTQNLIGKIAYSGGIATQFQVAMDFSLYPGVLFGVNPITNGCLGVPLNSVYVNTNSAINTNQWYCIVGTFDNGVMKIYLDGALIQTTNAGFTTLNQCTNATIQIGKWWTGDPLMYQGKIDDIRIYDRALNQDEVNVLCTQNSCNNWLSAPLVGSYVTVGDADVSGNQITVEASFNRTAPANSTGGYGFLVSKHTGPPDVNYALWPNGCAITTDVTGERLVFENCPIQINKTYHVAMVYDGATLKFYRNGYLHSQTLITGNLITNNFITTIGQASSIGAPEIDQFLGNINEVRIWNVARTQAQIQAYMNSSLPNPTTQTGLVAYYTFDDLLNKQGNTAFNGTLAGGATINSINPNCTFLADSCAVVTNIGSIINTYTPVLSLNSCDNKITVEDGSTFNTGDTVLMIQMKGAVIDSTNTASFGTITDYKNAGNYEFNYVKSKAGNVIELENVLIRQYDIPNGKVQLIRVPYYQNAIVTSTLTCLPWDGSKGGVLVLNVADSIVLNANIDVTGRGFNKAPGYNPQDQVLDCFQNNYNYPISSNSHAGQKGESITKISQNIICGKGAPAGGGGGGLGHNSGGGGGGNGGAGGYGGYQLEPCGNAPFDNRGIGGYPFAYNSTTNKIFMGSGGGAGEADNINGMIPSGGNGGGIIILISDKLKTNSFKIISNGDPGLACAAVNCHDGMGGGGAGGSVLLNINQILDNSIVENKGGKGADMIASVPLGGRIGPGGGGGGGLLFINNTSLPPNLTNLNTGGANGVLTTDANNPWGATSGQNGVILFNLIIPIDTVLFKPNIDSVRIKDSATGCKSFDFRGLGYTNTNPITSWQWSFGDGGTANTQNTSHTYNSSGTYAVKLIVTDINGCKDSITKNVTAIDLNFDFNYQFNTCNPLTVQFHGIGSDTQNPYWLFGDGGTNSGNLNPTHTYVSQGNYTIKYSVSNGVCSDTLTKVVSLNIINDNIILTNDTTICYGSTKQLLTVPALSFCWSPTTYLNNPNSPNPITSTTQNITYYYTAEVTGNNLIVNGDFNAGNTGFTSQYIYANPNLTEGQYFVGANPQAWNPSMSACTDHTTGTGNMMMINGAPVANVNVWKETVTVTPNTNYAFSTWIQALWPPNPAQLQFSINGNDIGNLITASLPTCTWTQFYTTWNSGNNTSAIISVLNKNTQVQGNDFALDDISFAPIFIKRDSVKIFVDSPLVRTNNDTTFCAGDSAQLNAMGASNYTWSPPTGLNNSNIPNPIASPPSTTQYIVTGTTVNGCSATDTIVITINPKPAITKSNDTTICRNTSVQLFASGGTTYSWTPATTLNNPSIANPIATPTTTTIYYVTVTNSNSCNNNDSVKVSIRPQAVFNISPDVSTCLNIPVQLNASGGNVYSWTPSNYLNDPNINDPQANPPSTTTYSVKIIESNCNDSATLTAQVTILPLPTIQATKQNDIDCSNDASQLNASGAMQYVWSPSGSLNNPNIANPIARPNTTTLYSVQGTDALGCTNTDTITVFILGINQGKYLMANGFTPNNDGINDCYGIKYWGIILELDFSIYNRWGERIFHTKTPGQCWNGTYKGQLQNPDVYVYMVKAKTSCDNNVFRKGTFVLIR